jgi:hypothetical protein
MECEFCNQFGIDWDTCEPCDTRSKCKQCGECWEGH